MLESQMFQALAEPARRAVFERLCRQEMSVAEITAGFPVSQPDAYEEVERTLDRDHFMTAAEAKE